MYNNALKKLRGLVRQSGRRLSAKLVQTFAVRATDPTAVFSAV
jgi:hypothetical protein